MAEGSRFVLLTTARRTGEKVATPFGALYREGRIYCYTAATSGKVKRVRRAPRVEIAPCTQKGETTGRTVAATARVLTGASAAPIEAAFDALWIRQYGPLWPVLKWIRDRQGRRRVVIEIVPDAALDA